MGTSYTKKQRTVRIPAVTDMQINHFSGGTKTEIGSYVYNGIILKYPNKVYYVTQRPTVTIEYEPADVVGLTDYAGRAVYYWDEIGIGAYVEDSYVDANYVQSSDTPALYLANLDTIYKDSYSTACSPTITAGTTRMYIKELGSTLVFLDAENNEMWYTLSGSATIIRPMNYTTTVAENFTFSGSTLTTTSLSAIGMTAGDVFTVVTASGNNDGNYTFVSETGTPTVITVEETFPTGETSSSTLLPFSSLPPNNSRALAAGLVILDQTMYVLATDGTVWGSAIGNAQNWTDALNVLTAEQEEDQGVFIAKHHNNIAVFGTRTIEFLYNAGNATGSSLGIRADVSYNIGCADPNSVWQDGDIIYFLGRNLNGQVQAYMLQEFKITPISEPIMSSLLNTAGFRYIGSGFTSAGISYYVITTATAGSSNVTPIETNVYNTNTQTWTEWEHAGSINRFPLINFTNTSGNSPGYGMFTSGELVTITDNYVPTEAGNNLDMKIRLDHFDNGNRDWKFGHQLRYVGDATDSSANLTVKWSDDTNNNYSAGRTIDISNSKDKLTRLGRFKSRSHELSYSGSEQIRIEGLDIDITEGTH